MNILKFFTQEEQIAGLAITEDAIRLIFLQQDLKTRKMMIATKEEELLQKGIITEGKVSNKEALTESLKKLLTKTKINLKYFIVSIPGDQAYYKVFTFPKSITDEKMHEAMELAISFQLPFAQESVYLDWEEEAHVAGSPEEVSIALIALKKEIAEDYLTCFKNAGIKTVALEIHPLSILRLAKPSTDTILVTEENEGSTIIFVVRDGIIRFLRTLPRSFVNKKDTQKEAIKIRNFYEASHTPITTILESRALSWRAEFLTYATELGDQAKWAVALGVAMRTTVERSEDKFLSLMPIGTEKAYEYQRAAAFANLITNVSVGLSFFFAMSFFASYILMLTIQGNFSTQISGLGTVAIPADTTSVEMRIQHMNMLITKTAEITKKIPRWSSFMEELTTKASGDITINNISVLSAQERISITGTAKDRVALNTFRNTLRDWKTITGLEFPTTNLEQKENIPFQASFSLSDPQRIYNWK